MVNGGTEIIWRNKQKPAKRKGPLLSHFPKEFLDHKPPGSVRKTEGEVKKKEGREINPLETRNPTD